MTGVLGIRAGISRDGLSFGLGGHARRRGGGDSGAGGAGGQQKARTRRPSIRVSAAGRAAQQRIFLGTNRS